MQFRLSTDVWAEFPELAHRYRATYARSHHAGEQYREGLARYFRKVCARYGVPFGRESGDDDEESETASDPQLTFELG